MLNLTPHHIVIVKANGDTLAIAPHGEVARVSFRDELVGNEDGIPVYKRRYEKVTGLVEGRKVIVSSLVLEALKTKPRPENKLVFSPDTGPGAVRDKNGNVIGVTRLIQCV